MLLFCLNFKNHIESTVDTGVVQLKEKETENLVLQFNFIKREIIVGVAVITSYSIHYTKLYER